MRGAIYNLNKVSQAMKKLAIGVALSQLTVIDDGPLH